MGNVINVTFHRPPEISPAFVDLYLDNADISAVRLLSAGRGQLSRFVFMKPPSKLPDGITLAETYWFPGKAQARHVMVDISELFLAGGLYRRKNSEWVELRAENAETALKTVATHLNVRFIRDKGARDLAAFQVARVGADFEKRMAAGEIRAVVNRRYRDDRESARDRGQRALPHHAYVRQLKERAIRESAAIWGRGALFAGDVLGDARSAAEAEGLLAKAERAP